jgi:adenylate cyclase
MHRWFCFDAWTPGIVSPDGRSIHTAVVTFFKHMSESTRVAILFADICESTKLYESAGDEEAYRLNGESLELMKHAAVNAGGTIIRTQGDGILGVFTTAAAALDAARAMQDAHKGGRVSIKVGIHFGAALRGLDGDVYGDAVNMAARISSQARPGETLLSGDAVGVLPPKDLPWLRMLDSTTFKGKTLALSVYTVTPETADRSQTLLGMMPVRTQAPSSALVLTHGSSTVRVDESRRRITLGRDQMCDLVVEASVASRIHAIVEVRRDRYVLTDQSTNGTWVSDGRGEPLFLMREATDLGVEGTISLGALPVVNSGALVRFRRAQ